MTPKGYLLDSHVLLWIDGEPDRLAVERLLPLLEGAGVFVSVATAWELSIKSASAKLDLRIPVSKMAAVYGFAELQISFRHVEVAAALPLHHRDPFDRLLIGQAIAENLILVTADEKIAQYPVPILRV